MTGKRKLFCSQPFSWFELTTGRGVRGEAYVCCPSWLPKPIGNLLDNSVEEIWNSEAAADIRRSILDGSFEYCSETLCPYLQTQTGPVQPVEAVKDPRMRRAIDENLQVLPWGPLEVNASHDRSCNLSCPSCRSHVIIEQGRSRQEILAIQKKLKEGALKDAKLLYVTGSGDPFGSPYLRELLQTLDRSLLPALETIHLQTNGLLWTKRMWQTLPEDIRALVRTAQISIDAASAETYAVNREGGEFDRLLENLDFIASELRPKPLERFGFSMVVQANNFREMPDFVRLGKRFNVDYVSFHQITNWGTFSEKQYRSRAIQFPTHPSHQDFLAELNNPMLDDPIVGWANLNSIRQEATARARQTAAPLDQRA